MDVDNENFYDEISSFMPQPGDYSFEDLDEIIRSTDSHLDASLDINTLENSFEQNDFNMAVDDMSEFGIKVEQQQLLSFETATDNNFENEFNFNFSAFPSPATSQQSSDFTSPYETPCRTSSPTSAFLSPVSHQSSSYLLPQETPVRTSSPTSVDDNNFNPDDFINFLNDDDIKINDLTTDKILKLNGNYRNTPSPTGSYTSSSGSSTSGVQSDASSVTSMSQNITASQEGDDELSEFIKFKNEKSDQDIEINKSSPQILQQKFDNGPVVIKEDDVMLKTESTETTFLPITVPVLPVTTTTNIQPIKIVQGTIIPVQTVPLTPVKPVVNIKASSQMKNDNKSSSNKTILTHPVKGVNAVTNSTKVTPPPNSKPKTIFLSSNDFKALMQKMNTNGKKNTGANGQTPKIIMKTASGKVISANKITNNFSSNTSGSPVSSAAVNNNYLTVSASNDTSLPFISKVSKTTGPMIIKQHSSKAVTSNSGSAAAIAAARARLIHTRNGRTDISMFKDLNDDKLLKKQLRMLKNRESASLSRKKKKEYVEKLENRISSLEKENYSLRGENSSLRSQLIAFAQTCNCKHGNVSEFILNTLNMDNKSGGAVLNAIDATYLVKNSKRHLVNCSSAKNSNLIDTTPSRTHHVKIAPKPANAGPFINKSFKQRMNAATVKKNVAVLFAMVFMVTWNFGYFQNYLNKSTMENAIEASVSGIKEEPVAQTGRRLLWVPNEHEFHEKVNRSKREIDMTNMPPPPLHFLRPVNRTTADKMNGTSAKDEPPMKKESDTVTKTTSVYANATLENMRLARNLHKWIGGNDYLNLTGTGVGNDIEEIEHFKFSSDSYMDYNLPLQAPIGTKQKRKIILDSHTQEKHSKLDIKDERNSLGLFKPRISEEYMRLFRGIKRQDDTIYVLSFNMDHILLPASSYNESSRPKMALMLPAGNGSTNGDIVLMQIDCEVVNTTELKIKSHMIPEKLKPFKLPGNVRVNPNDVANNETAGPSSATKTRNSPTKEEETKVKPSAPRTYFMMGPKNQVVSQSSNSIGNGASIVKRKPGVVKMNANDSVIGSGVLNVHNSTLFSRMRDSVGSQTNGFAAATDVQKLI